jgi:hypothetical protein
MAAGMDTTNTSSNPGNVATRWVTRTFDAVRTGNPAVHTSTPGAGRTYALTTVAMYDAVNGIKVPRGTSTRDSALVSSYDDAPGR